MTTSSHPANLSSFLGADFGSRLADIEALTQPTEKEVTVSVASGRARYEEKHPKRKPQPAPDKDPLDDGLDHNRISEQTVHETERTGQRGLKAGSDRFNKTHTASGQYRGNNEGYERD